MFTWKRTILAMAREFHMDRRLRHWTSVQLAPGRATRETAVNSTSG